MDELCDRLASALKITDVKRLNDIKALLYADDVALIAHSRTELQKMVNVVAKFAEDYRLEVNLKPGKTEIMPIYTSSKAKRPSIRERGEIQARYRLMCWNQLVGAKLKPLLRYFYNFYNNYYCHYYCTTATTAIDVTPSYSIAILYSITFIARSTNASTVYD
eukprot:g37832.t1